MALVLTEKPGLIEGSDAMEEIDVPELDAALLMSLLEESQCEEYCNEEQVNSLMESLEAEIRMASVEGDMESNDCFEWSEIDMAASSLSGDMNWYVEDHVEEMAMDGYLVQFGNDFPLNCYQIQSENCFSLWQETYDTVIYN
ncbi:hypothetical protein V6N13_049946 [Hibiscus sabdariffa]|uniref:Uncharacterized protein n=1 Tax=Hibiscus sabdariffa TaxID=183260 RepID=A0ABR2QVQ4_9ROSI